MNIAVVILAGGEGRRIGGGKPTRLLGDRSLLDRVMDKAQQWSDELAIAVRDKSNVRGARGTIIEDDPDLAGPLGGLAAALRFARCIGRPAVLVVPADSPFLPEDLADRLQDALASEQAAIARSGGRLHPACGLWRVTALPKVESYLSSSSRSLIGFAEHVGFATADWPTEPLDPFFNINTPKDLIEAERLLGGQNSRTSTRSPGD